MFSYLLH